MKRNTVGTSNRFGLSLAVSLLLFSTNSVLAKHHGDGEKRGKRGAPQEAIEACADLQIDEACQFEGRRGEVSGLCITPPEEEQGLVCKPERSRSRDRGETDQRG